MNIYVVSVQSNQLENHRPAGMRHRPSGVCPVSLAAAANTETAEAAACCVASWLACWLAQEGLGTAVIRSKSGKLQMGESIWEDWDDPDWEVRARLADGSECHVLEPCRLVS